jgi:septal ring factor EnvC (AmiA/AmiB activator)
MRVMLLSVVRHTEKQLGRKGMIIMPLNNLVKLAREVASEFGVELAEFENISKNDKSEQKEQRSLSAVLREISGAINQTTVGGRDTGKSVESEPMPDIQSEITALNAQINELKRRQRRLEAENKRLRAASAEKNARAANRRSVDLRGIRLDSQSARNAIILSEIIGLPLAKRSIG